LTHADLFGFHIVYSVYTIAQFQAAWRQGKTVPSESRICPKS
jgi:hypothetical protein